MAGLTRLRFARYGQSDSGHTDLDHHFHNDYPTYSAVRAIFDQLDLHNELYYAVCIVHKMPRIPKQANYLQNAHRPGLCVSRLLDRQVPFPEYVRATASRTSAQGTPD